MNIEDMFKIIRELEEYIQYEGTEIGEFCNHLIGIWYSSDYLDNKSKGFRNLIEAELCSQLDNFKKHGRFVEVTYPARIVKEFEWKQYATD